MILGGHDHDPITFYEGGVMIHKSGYDAHYLGAVDLSLEWVERARQETSFRAPGLADDLDRRGPT